MSDDRPVLGAFEVDERAILPILHQIGLDRQLAVDPEASLNERPLDTPAMALSGHQIEIRMRPGDPAQEEIYGPATTQPETDVFPGEDQINQPQDFQLS